MESKPEPNLVYQGGLLHAGPPHVPPLCSGRQRECTEQPKPKALRLKELWHHQEAASRTCWDAFVEQVVVWLELIHLQQLVERDYVARVLVPVQVARLPQRPERVEDYLTRARKPLLEVFDGRLLLLLLLGADDHLTRDLVITRREMYDLGTGCGGDSTCATTASSAEAHISSA
eukprot:scaffold28802_cov65-Phaeocystis_antarctica.AAC.6